MIYINENSGTINIPRHTFGVDGDYTFIISSNLVGKIVLVDDEYGNSSNISTNTLYYKFALGNLSDIACGEYTYQLILDGAVMEKGLLTFGNYSRTVIVNNTFNLNNKIQYNPNTVMTGTTNVELGVISNNF